MLMCCVGFGSVGVAGLFGDGYGQGDFEARERSELGFDSDFAVAEGVGEFVEAEEQVEFFLRVFARLGDDFNAETFDVAR